MADQPQKHDADKERRKADKRVITSPDYTGPDRRKTPRRNIDHHEPSD